MTEQTEASVKRQKLYSSLIAFSPLGVILLLFLLNPNYIMALLVREAPYILPSLPCGWVVVAAVLTMVVAARFIFWLADESIKSGRGRFVVHIIVFILFVLPAYFIVVLGPAGFQVLRDSSPP